MTDENDQPQASTDETAPEPAADKDHSLKDSFREGVSKVAGYTVEVASILAQQGGEAVKAEKETAEAGTEDFIDRIDGEG
jgi:hypothetical protein